MCVCVHVCMYYVLIVSYLLSCTDFVEMSRVLTFDADRTTESVGIGIFHDFEREIVTETIDLQLSLVEEERGSGLLLLPNRATVSIADNDGE